MPIPEANLDFLPPISCFPYYISSRRKQVENLKHIKFQKEEKILQVGKYIFDTEIKKGPKTAKNANGCGPVWPIQKSPFT